MNAPLAVADGDDQDRTGAPRRPPTLQGRVLLAGDTSVMLDIDGDHVELDYAELGPGQVQVEFGRPDTAGAGTTGTTGTTCTDTAGAAAGPMLDHAQARNGGGQDGH